MEDYRYNIVGFARKVLHQDILPWQEKVMGRIESRLRKGEPIIKVAIAGGHGSRKTNFMAIINSWMQANFEGAQSCITASKSRALRYITERRVRELDQFPLPGNFTNYVDCTDLEGFAGYMGRSVLMGFDEASGIPEETWEVAMSAMAESDGVKIFLATGVAHRRDDKFAKCFTDSSWHVYHIDSRDNTQADKEYFERLVEEYGRNSNYVRTRIMGCLPSSEED